MDQYHFYAKTDDAYTLKTLSEILQSYLNEVVFELTSEAILLETADDHNKISFRLNLPLENFNRSKSNLEQRYIGINIKHMYKLLKSIRKKDKITIFISKKEPNLLGLRVENYETNRVSTNYIKILTKQPSIIPISTDYNQQIIIKSQEFQRMCKDMKSMTDIIHIYSKGSQITFCTNEDEDYFGNVTFGVFNENLEDERDSEEYNASFDIKILQKLAKVTGLSKNVGIFTKPSRSLFLRIDVGSLGKLGIYICSNEKLTQRDNGEIRDDSDSDYDDSDSD